ncbi:pleiotropic drug resistance protein 3-like [Gossypium australe]|uniref:Pleiotropic drug resistance protein 3-like n=1 Tax=Gossypium australe TaxID=47621 RepID=A0A5B6WKD1_9ROSI|nr:pleiotropic drug resistance protein 3-like [Gossypium australe]
MDIARCLLFESKLPKELWAEVVNISVYLLNRLPTKIAKGKTPFKTWFGNKLYVSHLKVFGCVCFTHMPQVKRNKLERRSQPGIFLGYSRKGMRSIDEIYQRADVALLEPMTFEEAGTIELVDKPSHKKVIGVKWVFKTKLNADGSLNKLKARLVVKGFSQQYGIDYWETFTLVVRLDTIKLLLALAAQMGWKIHQLNVK